MVTQVYPRVKGKVFVNQYGTNDKPAGMDISESTGRLSTGPFVETWGLRRGTQW
jgi:hypothetical protein